MAVFPGQGAQAAGMGAAWQSAPEWEWVRRAEELLGEELGQELLTDAPRTNTRSVQLAVFLISWMAWRAAADHIGPPTVFAGHSLGQITAMAASGVLSFDDTIRVLAHRGEVTERVCREEDGGMLAVLGLGRDRASWACSAAAGACWIANDNAPGQLVASGTHDGLARLTARARELGATKLLPLSVDGPFHTPLMVPAARAFARRLAGTPFGRPARPLISNVDLRTLDVGEPWIPLLAEHLVLPVRWRPTQRRLVDDGVEELVEFGHGTTLTSLARRTAPELRRLNVDSPESARRFAGLVAA